MAWCVIDQNGTPQLSTARATRESSMLFWLDEVGRDRVKREWSYWLGEGYSCRHVNIKVF